MRIERERERRREGEREGERERGRGERYHAIASEFSSPGDISCSSSESISFNFGNINTASLGLKD